VTVRGVCFDATGTLIETRESVGAVYSRAAAAVGVKLPAWRLDDAFRRILRHGPSLASVAIRGATRGEREAAEIEWWRDRVRQTFQATDSTVRFADPGALFETLFDHYRHAEAWRIRPGAREALARVADEGFALGLASNFDHRLPKILEELDLARFFSVSVLPSQNGCAKPDRAVFETLARGLGCALEELAYVGDDAPEALAAIAALGLRVIDVRMLSDLAPLADHLKTVPVAEPANLDATADPRNPARATK
jgi:putative hydrolase of the HAD superfamily